MTHPTQQVHGFSLIEMIVVMAVIAILAALSFVGIADGQARGRDSQRTSDIDVIHSQLEQYYIDHGGYPETINTTVLPRLDPEALKDPDGEPIDIRLAVASQASATAITVTDSTGPDYLYIPYPTGCNGITCRGYVLKSFIERPTEDVANPYVRRGLHNN